MVQDICIHDAYVEPMRDEIQRVAGGRSALGSMLGVNERLLPILDSFVKESIRFTNPDASELAMPIRGSSSPNSLPLTHLDS